eukprot:jgi/Tetstr1/459230/TSEL_000040.t1
MTAKKLIIDTDPGIDDVLAIMMAFASTDCESGWAIRRCLWWRAPMGPLSGSLSKRIADFVHGADGFGEVYHSEPATKALSGITAAEFVVEQCRKYPGQVTFVALASMTNLALALKLEPELDELLKEVVFMGGAFRVNGNVNPAAEANVFADPDAAEFVLSTCSKVAMIGLDLTHKCFLTREEIENLRGKGSHGDFAASIIQFYLRYHERAYSQAIVYLHDPAAMAIALDPSLVTDCCQGGVAVATDGIMKGHTILDNGKKNWVGENPWMARPKTKVYLAADSEKIKQRCIQLLSSL